MKGDEDLRSDLPAGWGSPPHRGIGAGAGDGTGSPRCDPVAVLCGEVLIVCYVDCLGRPNVGEALLWAVEACVEQLQVHGARGDERAVTDDADIVLGEGVAHAKQVPSRNRTIGVLSGATDLRFMRLFVQTWSLPAVLLSAKQITLYRRSPPPPTSRFLHCAAEGKIKRVTDAVKIVCGPIDSMEVK